MYLIIKNKLLKHEKLINLNKPPQFIFWGTSTWPDRLNKSGSPLSLSEGEKFIEILNDHHLEQLFHFPTRERNTLGLIITSLPASFLISSHRTDSVIMTLFLEL